MLRKLLENDPNHFIIAKPTMKTNDQTKSKIHSNLITLQCFCRHGLYPSNVVFNHIQSLEYSFRTGGKQSTKHNATSVFHTGQMILPGNVKHLVILIPNEGHHGPGEEDESRFIAQPFVPQNAILSPGTEVVWFSGDVGHEYNIVVRNAAAVGTQVFETGEFPELAASRPIVFNNTGNFEYADTIEYEEGFVMTGNVTVADQNSGASTPLGISDTVGLPSGREVWR
jgi:plastocyanin